MKTSPAIFYVPHPDDEAIGMAGSISKHREAGGQVYLVLLTDGYNEKTLRILNGQVFCTWHKTIHQFSLTMEQLTWARKIEFISSANALGADKTFIIGDGRGLPDVGSQGFKSYEHLVSGIREVARRFASTYPAARHHFTSGNTDPICLPRSRAAGSFQPTHMACYEAALSLREELKFLTFHRIYTYLTPPDKRKAPLALDLHPDWQSAKRAALSQYKQYQPDLGRYAIGYHSTGALIDAASADHREYMDPPPAS
ncbi:MAG TPA: PIG-L family deacetylase [Pyrinomonadaceae bacterium]